MNALDQTKSPDLISKIAAAANACREVFPRGEVLLSPFTEEGMGEVWNEYIESSQNTIDFAIKTKTGVVSFFVVAKEDDLRKSELIIVDYVSNDTSYAWESEFDLVKKTKKEIVLTSSEYGNLPKHLKPKIHDLCGRLFYIFDARIK